MPPEYRVSVMNQILKRSVKKRENSQISQN